MILCSTLRATLAQPNEVSPFTNGVFTVWVRFRHSSFPRLGLRSPSVGRQLSYRCTYGFSNLSSGTVGAIFTRSAGVDDRALRIPAIMASASFSACVVWRRLTDVGSTLVSGLRRASSIEQAERSPIAQPSWLCSTKSSRDGVWHPAAISEPTSTIDRPTRKLLRTSDMGRRAHTSPSARKPLSALQLQRQPVSAC